MKTKNHGYYVCNGKEFISKVDACIYSEISKKPIEWKFLDEFYKPYHWDVEPEATLDQLYDLRARELREKYDYIILSFSGGSDSNNMVESFIRQGLHIDEILTNHLSTAAAKTTVHDENRIEATNFHAEHDLQALPRLRELYNRIPKTKITVLDVSDTLVDTMKSTFEDERWVLHGSDHLSISYQFRTNYTYFAEIKKRFDAGKRIGFILGADKPNTYLDGNDLYVVFADRVANLPNLSQHNKEYDNISLEFFYWAESTAPLVCKQAHVIKRWLAHAPESIRESWRRRDMLAWRTFKEQITRGLVYTTWRDDWFQTSKSDVWWNSHYDYWAHTNPELMKVREKWKRGLDFLVDKAPSYIVYKNGVADALTTCNKHYCVGNIYPNTIQLS
jgi:hypothetical protein